MTVQVDIDVDAQGNISVTPDPVHLSSGDSIHWHQKHNQAFAIDFPGASPFGGGNAKHFDQNHPDSGNPSGPKGVPFKYNVGTEGHHKDPSVIID